VPRLEAHARPEYVAAFAQIVARIAATLPPGTRRTPVKMYVAGGAAMHFYTGERVSRDIDAVFSLRIALPEDLEVSYRDADGAARMLYFDRQYNDTLGLLHEDAHKDSLALELEGVDRRILEVRLLSPLDLAVTKIGRLADQDRDDIAALARRKLITAAALRKRAEEATGAYVGDLTRLHNSINIACRVVEDATRRGAKPS
jgi:hypothetical protein